MTEKEEILLLVIEQLEDRNARMIEKEGKT
jgi:hypothetical protein